MDTLHYILGGLTACLALLSFLLYRSKLILANSYSQLQAKSDDLNKHIDFQVNYRLEEKVGVLREKIAELKEKVVIKEQEGYKRGRSEAKEEFERDYFVMVSPYKEVYEEGIDLILYNSKTKVINIGFQYQLFVKGLPMFEPSVILVEEIRSESKSFNEERITAIVTAAIGRMAPYAGSFLKISDKLISRQIDK